MRVTRNRSKAINSDVVQEISLPTPRRVTRRTRQTVPDSNDDHCDSVSISSNAEDFSQSEIEERQNQSKVIGTLKLIKEVSESSETNLEKNDEANKDDDDEYEDDAVVGERISSSTTNEPDHTNYVFELPDDADEAAIEAAFSAQSDSDDYDDSDDNDDTASFETKAEESDRNEKNEDDDDDDDAPEEVSFNAAKSRAVEDHRKKVAFERSVKESIKEKRRQLDERNANQKSSVKSKRQQDKTIKRTCPSEPEAIRFVKQKKVKTVASKLNVITSDPAGINSMFYKHVKANASRNNRVISFKDNAIMKRHVKRISAKGYARTLQKSAALKL